MGPIRFTGIVIGILGFAAGIYVVWHFVFINDGWTAGQMDPWLLTAILGTTAGIVLFFWPRKKGPWG